MNSRRLVAAACAVAACGTLALRQIGALTSAQLQAQTVEVPPVPKAWGKLVAGSGGTLTFEAADGTIRVVILPEGNVQPPTRVIRRN